MIEWISEWWASLTWSDILIAAGLFILSLVISLAALTIVAVKIPRNYFSSHYRKDFMPDSPWIVRWGSDYRKERARDILDRVGNFSIAAGYTRTGFSDHIDR